MAAGKLDRDKLAAAVGAAMAKAMSATVELDILGRPSWASFPSS